MSGGISSIGAATLDRLLRLQAYVVEQTELLKAVQDDTTQAASAAAQAGVDGLIAAIRSGLSAHEADRTNPHAVTASQVGAYTTDQVDAAIAALRAALKIGAFVQRWSPSLDALSGLNTTTFGRALLALADGPAGLAAFGAAPILSPQLSGAPTAPTAAPGTRSTQLATTAYADASAAAAAAAIVNGAPAVLDTLRELADALGDDPNFAATIAAQIASKAGAGRQITAGAGLAGGGDLTADRALSLAPTAAGTLLANLASGVAVPVPVSLAAVMDSVFGAARGSIAVRGSTGWAPLALGAAGYVLQSNGTDLVFSAATPGTARYDVSQALAGSQRIQAKQNIGALGTGYAYVGASASLLAASAGQTLLVASGISLTLPDLATMRAGDLIALQGWGAVGTAPAVIGSASSQNIGINGTRVASFNLRSGQFALLAADLSGSQWVVFGYGTPQDDAPSFNAQQSPSRAQMAQVRANAGGAYVLGGNYYAGSATLSASDANKTHWTNSDAFTLTLPATSALASGDGFEFINYGAGTITFAVAGGATPFWYSGNYGVASVTLGPGQILKISTNGSIYVCSHTLAPEFAVTTRAQTLSAADQAQARANIGAMALVAQGGNAQLWYRKYADGWLEQGGIVATTGDQVINFAQAFSSAVREFSLTPSTPSYDANAYTAHWDTVTLTSFACRVRKIASGGTVSTYATNVSYRAGGY